MIKQKNIKINLLVKALSISLVALTSLGIYSLVNKTNTNQVLYYARNTTTTTLKSNQINLYTLTSNIASNLRDKEAANISDYEINQLLADKNTINQVLMNPGSTTTIKLSSIIERASEMIKIYAIIENPIRDGQIVSWEKQTLTIQGFKPLLSTDSNIESWQVITIILSTIGVFLFFIIIFLLVAVHRRRMDKIWDDEDDQELFDNYYW